MLEFFGEEEQMNLKFINSWTVNGFLTYFSVCSGLLGEAPSRWVCHLEAFPRLPGPAFHMGSGCGPATCWEPHLHRGLESSSNTVVRSRLFCSVLFIFEYF